MPRIDLNCDMGESFGPWRMGADEQVMPHITSANVACGAHAGDPNVMASTVRLALLNGVAIGAHPGYPDLQGFGRRAIKLTSEEIRNMVLSQLGALWAICRAYKAEIHHVKPHGALYNLACQNGEVARPVVAAVLAFLPGMPLYCLPDSVLSAEAQENGLKAVHEGFVDRAYEPSGLLVDRNRPDSVSSSPEKAAGQAVQLASGSVICRDGTLLSLQVQTLCVHGDTPGAPRIAQAVNDALRRVGYLITSNLNA